MSGRYIAAQAASGARHDRRDRRPQLRPVPDDARLAGARDPQPAPHARGRSPRSASGGASTSRSSRTSSSPTSTSTADGRPRLLDQVPRPAGDRGRRSTRPARRSSSSASARRSRSSSACGSAPRPAGDAAARSTASATALSLILYSMPYFVIGMPLIIIFAAGLGWFPTSGMTTPGGNKTPIEAAVRLRAPPRPAADRGRARPDRRVLDPHALVDHRDALRGLHHDRPGQGPARRAGSCARTRSPTRCCRWSRSSRSTSATSSPARSPPRSCSTGRASARSPSQALDARDYPLLQAIFLLIAVSVVLANFAADIVYGYLDPRVRA